MLWEIVVDESQTMDPSIFQRLMIRSYPLVKTRKEIFSVCVKKNYSFGTTLLASKFTVSETVRNVVPEPSEMDSNFETEQ